MCSQDSGVPKTLQSFIPSAPSLFVLVLFLQCEALMEQKNVEGGGKSHNMTVAGCTVRPHFSPSQENNSESLYCLTFARSESSCLLDDI